jgi:hypothetical protein
MWLKETEWQIVTLLVAKHASGPNKLFFHLLDLTILNSYIPSSSCGKKFSHRDVRDMLTHARREPGCEKHLKEQHMCHLSG